MPPEVSQTLLSGRYEGDEAKKDIHERDRAYLLRCRDSALYAAGAMGWQVISLCRSGPAAACRRGHGEAGPLAGRLHDTKR